MQNVNLIQEVVSIPVEIKEVRCQPLQGTINRMVVKANSLLSGSGHVLKRWMRDYASGTASYVCPHCGATAHIDAKTKTMSGSALSHVCTKSEI